MSSLAAAGEEPPAATAPATTTTLRRRRGAPGNSLAEPTTHTAAPPSPGSTLPATAATFADPTHRAHRDTTPTSLGATSPPRGSESQATSEPAGAIVWEELCRTFAGGSDGRNDSFKGPPSPLHQAQSWGPEGDTAAQGVVTPALLADLEWAIQLAIMKSTVCIICVAGLCLVGWQVFHPVLSPILLAAGCSVVTHSQHHKNANSRFLSLHKHYLSRALASAPAQPVLRSAYIFLARCLFSFLVWSVVPQWLADVSGASLLVRNLVAFWESLRRAVVSAAGTEAEGGGRSGSASPASSKADAKRVAKEVRRAGVASSSGTSRSSPSPEKGKGRRPGRERRRGGAPGSGSGGTDRSFARDSAIGLALLILLFVGFGDAISLHIVSAFSLLLGSTLMVSVGPEKSAAAVKVMATVGVVWVLGLHVFGSVVVEVLEMGEYTQHRVQAAGSMVNEAVEGNNATELLMHYAATSIEQAAESQNISLAAVRAVIDAYNSATRGFHPKQPTFSDLKWWQSLWASFDYTALSTIGGGTAFWLDLSTAFGTTTMAVSRAALVAVSSAAGAVASFFWGCWTVVLFGVLLLAFNQLQHTLPYYLLVTVVQRDVAVKFERETAHHLTALAQSLVHVFIFHFSLTLMTLQRFGSSYPYLGATLAGFFALFPYLPKYFLVPFPLLVALIQQVAQAHPGEHDEAMMCLYELLVWILVPLMIGDDWIFAEIVEGYIGPKMVVLSFVMGFYNFGAVGVLVGPLVVALFGSIASSAAMPSALRTQRFRSWSGPHQRGRRQ